MSNRIIMFFCIMVIMQSCNSLLNYLPGFDFKLFKNTPVWELAKAVENENVQKINELLKKKQVNVDYQEPKFGHTLLMLAVANNKAKAVEALLNNGANPNLTSKSNDNAVSIAAENYSDVCDTITINKLHKFGGNLNYIQNIERNEDNGMHTLVKRTILMIAARNDCFAISKYIVENGGNINEWTYYEGYGVITEAIIQDNLKLAKYLIINKKAVIPPYIFKRKANISYQGEPEKNLTITDLLNEKQFEKGSENYKLREEIINYLKSENQK